MTKLKNSKSFEQWCIENNRQDVLERWDYDLNINIPNTISYGTKKFYYFKCPKGLHKSELKKLNSFTSGQQGSISCKQCNSFAQWGIDNIEIDFLNKYWDYNKNIINPWDISYGSKKKVWIKCQEKDYHGSYDIFCCRFIVGDRCSYCHGLKIHKNDSLGWLYPKVLKIWSNKNKKSIFEFLPWSIFKVWWKCCDKKHKDYYRTISDSTKRDFRCPECVRERSESILQEKVRLYLNELGYLILHEHNCTVVPKNPKTKYTMPFDNEIEKLKLIIEVNGSQHYSELSGKWFNKNFNLHKRQLYDRYKRIFAKRQGYFYLEIPYWTDDKEETWKEIINNKINEILLS